MPFSHLELLTCEDFFPTNFKIYWSKCSTSEPHFRHKRNILQHFLTDAYFPWWKHVFINSHPPPPQEKSVFNVETYFINFIWFSIVVLSWLWTMQLWTPSSKRQLSTVTAGLYGCLTFHILFEYFTSTGRFQLFTIRIWTDRGWQVIFHGWIWKQQVSSL